MFSSEIYLYVFTEYTLVSKYIVSLTLVIVYKKIVGITGLIKKYKCIL